MANKWNGNELSLCHWESETDIKRVSKGEITAVGKLLSLYFERLPFVRANVSLRSEEFAPKCQLFNLVTVIILNWRSSDITWCEWPVNLILFGVSKKLVDALKIVATKESISSSSAGRGMTSFSAITLSWIFSHFFASGFCLFSP